MSWLPEVREIVLSLLLGSILIASIVNFNYPRFAEKANPFKNFVINVDAEYQISPSLIKRKEVCEHVLNDKRLTE